MSDLTAFLKAFDKNSPKNILSTLNYIYRYTNESTVNIIVPFLVNLKDKKLSVPDHYKKSTNYAIHLVTNKLKKTNFKYKMLIDQIQINTETRVITKKVVFNLKQSVIDIIFPLLLRVSYKEFENVIHSHYHKQEIKYTIKNDLIQIHKLKRKANIPKSYYSIITTLHTSEIPDVINYFIEYKSDATSFFTVLYLSDYTLYNEFCQIIFDKYSTYNRIIRALPEINHNTLSDIMIKYFVENRPVQINKIVELLAENRCYLINLVKEFYDNFDIPSLNLIFEEDLLISECNDKHALSLISNIIDQDLDDEKLRLISNVILNKDTTFINQVIDTFAVTNTFERILSLLVKQKRLPIEVQKKLETKFIDCLENYDHDFVKNLFFGIINNLENNKVVNNLESFLKNEEDLKEFLRVLLPFQILYNIHYFKDIENSLLASSFIMPKKDIFNEQICMNVIQKMEESALPPIFMRTVMLSLINFPILKKFTVDLCYRLIKYEIWTMPRLYNGYIKCLSFLGSSCAEIIMALPRERMIEILGKNVKILKICENWIKNNQNIKGSYAFNFKNAIYSQLKNHK